MVAPPRRVFGKRGCCAGDRHHERDPPAAADIEQGHCGHQRIPEHAVARATHRGEERAYDWSTAGAVHAQAECLLRMVHPLPECRQGRVGHRITSVETSPAPRMPSVSFNGISLVLKFH
jgi:hypothetical protein